MSVVFVCPSTGNLIDPGAALSPAAFDLNCPHCAGTHNTGQLAVRSVEVGGPAEGDAPVSESKLPPDRPSEAPPGPPGTTQDAATPATGGGDEVPPPNARPPL